jgi:hypothetical protein
MTSLSGDVNWNDIIDNASDEQLAHIAASTGQFSSWQSPMRINNDKSEADPDGFNTGQEFDEFDFTDINQLQADCWKIFTANPHINSHIRDMMGRLTGADFEISGDTEEIQDLIELITDDVRNELTKNYSKWVARAEIEGELFLALTLHRDGFVEVDFMEPRALTADGDEGSGIFFHPKKGTIPVLYCFNIVDEFGMNKKICVPSIYCAYYPEFLEDTIKANKSKSSIPEIFNKSNDKKFGNIGGYKTFIVSWNRGYLRKRNISHIRTVLEWVNYYSQLKRWEIDHKKSSGAYLWHVKMTDWKAFNTWLKMTDAQRAQTGITAKKVPGGTLITMPGMDIDCINPQLGSINEQDTDILHMISSGLNKPSDMLTGKTSGDTYSGVKVSRGPQNDRISDEVTYWERFLINDFWRGIIFLHHEAVPSFKMEYKVKKTIDFKNKKPKQVNKIVPAYKRINITFPSSEIVDLEAKARALLGVNHQSVVESLGIPRSKVAKKLGFSDYRGLRYQYEDEDNDLPELPLQTQLLEAMSSQKEAGGTSQKEQGGTPLKKNENKQKSNDDNK